ncbi:UNVERIFIED_CONTAM: hypothetical protein Slati_0947000 [Sesamum latifolium]|uniref:Uncharacterized protein n=1 Tax=Sesamum latifolium TaxID=2727402 RepID=A0AAW2XQF7_9LAMI
MFSAKICSPWREVLIQSYKVPEGKLNSVAKRMSFLKDKLKDWYYQASIQKNMKRLREESQVSQGRGKNRTMIHTLEVLGEPISGEDHGGPNPRLEPINLDKGPDQQGLHPKDLDKQMQDPQDKPLQGELSDEPILEPMKVSKTATVGSAEQKVTYLQTTRRNMVKYANLKSRMTS